MATYANNTTIKISQAISNAVTFGTNFGTQTLYTCPANRYAKITYKLRASAGAFEDSSVQITIGSWGRSCEKPGSGVFAEFPGQNDQSSGTDQVLVGPGQSVVASGIRGSVGIIGVEFINTP